MKHHISGPLPDHARNIMQRLGYGEKRTFHGQISFTRRASSGSFPRYHIYTEERDGGLQINLHLDQKEHGAGGGSVHAGEYDGPVVQREMQRIIATIQTFGKPGTWVSANPARDEDERRDHDSTKGFWKGLFG